jgi:hypothetical protein
MWTTVLILAGSVVFEPIRLGLVILLLNRRRPVLQLLVFWCGGLTMGVGLGLVLLFALRTAPVLGHLRVAEVQIGCGLIALLIAVALQRNGSLANVSSRASSRATVGSRGGVALLDRPPESGRHQLAERARCCLQADSLWFAGIGGLAAALPSANYLGAMAAILASHAAPLAQAEALLAFNLTAFAVVEFLLIAYLAAPRRARAFAAAPQTWLRSRSRRDAATLVGAGGCFMLVLGLSNL